MPNRMEFSDVKAAISSCSRFAGLSEDSLAALLWTAEEVIEAQGNTIFAEGQPSDSTFCLLVAGELNVSRNGNPKPSISPLAVFGELGLINPKKTRTATVSVATTTATYLKFSITEKRFSSQTFAALRKCLSSQAFDYVVLDSKDDL